MNKIDNKDRILKNIIKEQNIKDSSIELGDNVVFYHNGNNYVVVPISLMKIYPLIYDSIDVEYNGSKYNYNVTLVHCPQTSYTVLLHGQYTLEDYTEDDRIIISDKDKTIKNKAECSQDNKSKTKLKQQQLSDTMLSFNQLL